MQKRILHLFPIVGGNTKFNQLRVELYYNLGGMNYFQCVVEKRGLYLSVTPIQRTENTTITTGFSGYKAFVKEMARFNQKTLDTFVPEKFLLDRLIDEVIRKNGLEVDLTKDLLLEL